MTQLDRFAPSVIGLLFVALVVTFVAHLLGSLAAMPDPTQPAPCEITVTTPVCPVQ
jgi:hypothetical protein